MPQPRETEPGLSDGPPVALGPATRRRRRFCLVLIKPSHYDDDGYVIQWYRSAIPSNSLAVLYGLAKTCAEQKSLGEDIEFEIHGFDETNTRIDAAPDRRPRQGRRYRAGDAGRRAVQPVSPRPRHRPAAAPARHHGGHRRASMSPAPSPCSTERDPDVRRAEEMGVFLFAGEAEEGRLEQVLRDAIDGRSQPLYNFMNDLPNLEGVPAAGPAGSPHQAHRRRAYQLRCRARLSLSMLLLHHHQCPGAQIAASLARRYRGDRARQSGPGHPSLLHHRRQFRPQQGLGADHRSPDPAARERESQVQLHHPGGYALPPDPEFHREMRPRRGQARLHRTGEHQSREPDGRQEAPEQDHRIPQDAAGLEERRRHHLLRLYPGLSQRHDGVDPTRYRDHPARAAGRSSGVLPSDAPAGVGGSQEAPYGGGRHGPRHEQIRSQPRDDGPCAHVALRNARRPMRWPGTAITRRSISRRC